MSGADQIENDESDTKVRYRVLLAKKEERTLGPEAKDARAEITAPIAVVTAEGFDAAVAYMQGKISATGHIGTLLEMIANGEATKVLVSLASPI